MWVCMCVCVCVCVCVRERERERERGFQKIFPPTSIWKSVSSSLFVKARWSSFQLLTVTFDKTAAVTYNLESISSVNNLPILWYRLSHFMLTRWHSVGRVSNCLLSLLNLLSCIAMLVLKHKCSKAKWPKSVVKLIEVIFGSGLIQNH